MENALSSEDTSDQVVDLDDTATVVEGEGGGEGEATAEPEVIENVIEESGSRPEKVATQASVDRLVRKLGQTKSEVRDAAGELELERQKRQMLELALQQEREAKDVVAPPDPATFDEGTADPEYAKAHAAYVESIAAKAVQKHAPSPAAPSGDGGLEQKTRAHAERAVALGVSDYLAVQDVAVDILGGKTVNEIIKASDRSEVILYHLGKNPDRAEHIAGLINTNPVAATLEIGRLDARLEVKPKTAKPIPYPDTDVQGGTPTAGQANQFQKRLDKAREAAGETRSMSGILAIKKEAAEAGVTVI